MSSKLRIGLFFLVCACLVLAAPVSEGHQFRQKGAQPRKEPPPSDKNDEERPARLRVLLPGEAKLVVEGVETKQKGPFRRFRTPYLTPGKSYKYTLECTYEQDGRTVTIKRVVRVRAGDDIEVNLNESEAVKPKIDDKPMLPDKPRVAVKPETNKKTLPEKNPPKAPPREPDVIFIPTPQKVVDKMLEMAAVTKDDVVYDLGCGDGIIVITAAKKYKCKAVGFDIDPKMVQKSRENVKKQGVEKLVTIEEKDFLDLDLKGATVVTLFLTPKVNLKLLPQLEKLKPGSRIVSHDFGIEGRKPKDVKPVKDEFGDSHKVYLWVTPMTKEE